MHICFITHEYPKQGFPHGGIGSFVQTIARACVKSGFTVSVVGIGYTYNDEKEEDQGVLIHRIGRSKAKLAKFLWNARNINKTLDTIHEAQPIDIIEGAELEFAFIKKNSSIQYVLRMHGGHHFFAKTLGAKVNRWKAFKEKKSFAKADHFIAVSDFVGSKTAALLKRKIEYKLIYNFVDTDQFSTNVTTPVTQNKLVFIGAVCEKKGIRQLIQALPIIKTVFQDISLDVIGRDWFFPDGSSYIKYLKEELGEEALNIANFIGAIPYEEIPERIASAEVCVFPSHMESFGLTIVEAMAMKKPVVAGNIAPFNEIAGCSGVVSFCDPFSPEDIADKIINLLKDKKRMKDMGEKSKQRIDQLFTKKTILAENIAYYKSLL